MIPKDKAHELLPVDLLNDLESDDRTNLQISQMAKKGKENNSVVNHDFIGTTSFVTWAM